MEGGGDGGRGDGEFGKGKSGKERRPTRPQNSRNLEFHPLRSSPSHRYAIPITTACTLPAHTFQFAFRNATTFSLASPMPMISICTSPRACASTNAITDAICSSTLRCPSTRFWTGSMFMTPSVPCFCGSAFQVCCVTARAPRRW